MKKSLTQITAVALALLLVSSGFALAATFDSETTTTTSTSDISGTSNTVTLVPGAANEALYVETDGATNSNADDLTLEISPAQKGVDYVAYQNSSADAVDATNGHFSFNVTHDELSDLPRDEAGGTYNVTVHNSSEEILNTEVTFETSNADDDNAILVVSDDAGTDGAAMSSLVADDLELSSKSGLFGVASLWSNGTDVSTWSGYTTVNGSSSSVTVDLANSTTSSAYSSAAENYDEGDWMTESTMFVNGVPVQVYKTSAPDSVESGSTYAVYDNSSDELTVELGDEYAKTSNLQLRATAGEGYGFGTIAENFGYSSAVSSLIPDLGLV